MLNIKLFTYLDKINIVGHLHYTHYLHILIKELLDLYSFTSFIDQFVHPVGGKGVDVANIYFS